MRQKKVRVGFPSGTVPLIRVPELPQYSRLFHGVFRCVTEPRVYSASVNFYEERERPVYFEQAAKDEDRSLVSGDIRCSSDISWNTSCSDP